jgi:hypothetical protein
MIRRLRRRRGFVMLLVVACLALLFAVFAILLRLTWVGRSQVMSQQRHVQADWLAESGLERAAARLAESPDYYGETWHVAAEDLNGHDDARVQIIVEVPTSPECRRVRVVADYPSESAHRVRRTRDAFIRRPTPSRPTNGEAAP